MCNNRKLGISLIVLVITIIVLIIIVTAVVLGLSKNNFMDSAKKAKFMANFTNVEEGVTIYATSKLSEENIDYSLPISEKVSLNEKASIKKDIPTLQAKIEELSGESIDNVDLYHIDPSLIGAENLYKIKSKGYLIDAKTRQIYDYEGEFFEGLRWHTLDAGVGEIKVEPEPEIWDGWIKLTLFYPSTSTDRMWRLSSNGETRTDTSLSWENYTGPISVPINRVQDIWIKYKIKDGTTIVIPPSGVALVDIEPDTTEKDVSSVKVNITYDSDATTKEYKVGDGGWKTYTGEFTVTKNCLIEARVIKPDNVYDSTGKLIITRNAENSDAYYVGNIKEPGPTVETSINAPRIIRMSPTISGEVAKVRVTYPAEAVTKVYTMDYGVEQTYTDDISIETYGTYIMAYYYTSDGKKSPASRILINDTSGGGTISPPVYDDLSLPKINNLGQTKAGEITALSVTYPAEAVTKVYKINGGAEIPYTGNISITAYKTYVKAYYYAADGRMSNYDWIYITEAGTEGPPPPTYIRPNEPTIVLNPSTVTTSTQVSINAPSSADRIYISIGYGAYELYTSPVTVSSNTTIRSYYITYDGKTSYTATKRISIIRGGTTTSGVTMPYVGINVAPYTSSLVNKVSVSLSSADADTVEYSFDGIVYIPYTGAFDVTENCTVYAKATNINGISTDKENLTNIGTTPPIPKTVLGVNISATPEPSASTMLTDKVKISIEYDVNTTDKYYRIGESGELTKYTGEFEVTKNCTIYAYALSKTGKGTDTKIIDNIVDGISAPVITSNPSNSVYSSKDKITITYDKNATTKQYKIDYGSLRDYVSELEVTKNCTIYAYSKNIKGEESSSSYIVTNITAPPKVITIDYGKYFLLKLNYPEDSTTKEYKWKLSGIWKTYKDSGILLIKPQYKDEFLDASGAIIVKIKDENGIETVFTGDYYLLDVGVSEINENLFMRWDRVSPSAPEILPDTTEPTKEVNVTINYADYLIKKQYKIVDKSGNIVTDWKDYTGPIKIADNNTTVYAKGQDDAEVWSSESSKKITNIDELAPEIKLTVDTTKLQQNVPVRVSATDDVAVGKVKWANGIQADSYFSTGGTEISNNSVVNITSNGYYTFYVEDKAGNTQIYTLNITNVDLNPPLLGITVTPDTTVGTSVQIAINYGDSVTKQYKIGESNSTWSTYTGTIPLTSYTVLSNNWKNSDGTVTVYAKGTDSVGNVKNEIKKIVNLDLDMPAKPVINSNAGYPILTSYGVIFNATTTIVYDSRTDIYNYYSTDNGTTWKIYTGSFNYPSGTIIAKSVKKDSLLEASSTKSVTIPSNALGTQSYDKNEGTSTYYYSPSGIGIMNIDSSTYGRQMRLHTYSVNPYNNGGFYVYLNFADSTGKVLSSVNLGDQKATFNSSITIPQNTSKIYFTNSGNNESIYIYEIELMNEPVFTATNGYMLLHADSAKAIKTPYQMVTISYFPTSVKRLYSVDGGTTWLDYNDKAIWLNQGATIYAKGIDKDGNQTRVISSYTANVSNALTSSSVDGNEGTYSYYYSPSGTGVIYLDSSIYGKQIRLHTYSANPYSNGGFYVYLNFADSTGKVLSSINLGDQKVTFNSAITVPQNASIIYFTNSGNNESIYIYEIEVMNEPVFTATNGYMLLTWDPANAIRKPYQNITISYFPTSVQRLYSLDGGTTWLNYVDKFIKLDQGSSILAKGIDKYGNQTRIISSYTSNIPSAIDIPAYDVNYSTYYETWNTTSKYMDIDSSMQGKKARIYIYTAGTNNSLDGYDYVKFFNSSGAVVLSIPIYLWKTTYNNVITIPTTATRMGIYAYSSQCYMRLYEIQPST